VESDESLGYHCGSWLGDGIQPLDGLTEGDEANILEWSPLPSLAGDRAASSPAAEQTNRNEFPLSHNSHVLKCATLTAQVCCCWYKQL